MPKWELLGNVQWYEVDEMECTGEPSNFLIIDYLLICVL